MECMNFVINLLDFRLSDEKAEYCFDFWPRTFYGDLSDKVFVMLRSQGFVPSSKTNFRFGM